MTKSQVPGGIALRPCNPHTLSTPGEIKKRLKHVKKFLSAIENLLEGKITQDVQAYSIEGRSLTRLSLTELTDVRCKYLAEFRELQRLMAIQVGLINPNKVIVRF